MSDSQLWSACEYGQMGGYEKYEAELSNPKFFNDLVQVETVSLFSNHICFSVPKKGHLVLRFVKQEVTTERWVVEREEYDYLVKLKTRQKGEWEKFLEFAKKDRSLELKELSDPALQICRRMFANCAHSVRRLRFMDLSFTEARHQALFRQILNVVSCFVPNELQFTPNTEFDSWLGNFIYTKNNFIYPADFVRPFLRNVNKVYGISRCSLALFWEQMEIDWCEMHYTAFWIKDNMDKIQAKVKRLVVHEADEFFLNLTLMQKLHLEELTLNFANRQVMKLEKTNEPFALRKLTLNETLSKPQDFVDYTKYFEYLNNQGQGIQELVLNFEFRAMFSVEFVEEFCESFIQFQQSLSTFGLLMRVSANLLFELNFDDPEQEPRPIINFFSCQGDKSQLVHTTQNEYTYHYAYHSRASLDVKLSFTYLDAMMMMNCY